MTEGRLFRFDHVHDTVVVVPTCDLGEFEFQRIEDESRDILANLNQGRATNVVIDCEHTDYFGSAALGYFLKLWKRVRDRGGRMAICNLSELERQVLKATRLDTLWSVVDTRAAALAAVRSGATKIP